LGLGLWMLTKDWSCGSQPGATEHGLVLGRPGICFHRAKARLETGYSGINACSHGGQDGAGVCRCQPATGVGLKRRVVGAAWSLGRPGG
jgi:hypothetical protein